MVLCLFFLLSPLNTCSRTGTVHQSPPSSSAPFCFLDNCRWLVLRDPSESIACVTLFAFIANQWGDKPPTTHLFTNCSLHNLYWCTVMVLLTMSIFITQDCCTDIANYRDLDCFSDQHVCFHRLHVCTAQQVVLGMQTAFSSLIFLHTSRYQPALQNSMF